MPRTCRALAATWPMALALALACGAPSAAWGQAAPRDPEVAALIEGYGLREAPEPVAARPGWRRPQRLLVDGAVPGLEDAVRRAAPGVTVVAAATPAEFVARVADADAMIGRTGLLCTEPVLAAARELRWIQLVSAGVEVCVARPAIASGRYLFTNMRAISAPVIAEHTIGMLLALTRGLTVSIPRQAAGLWSGDYGEQPLVTLQGKTLLVVGLGGIGGEIAKRADALGMRVIATRGSSRERPPYVDYVGLADELPQLLGQADVVANALPLTAATRNLFDAAAFARMRPTAYFLNVGRGGTVVTTDLAAALVARRLAGAGLDVTEPEPLPKEHPLWRAPNVVITPHNSNESDLGVEAQRRVIAENVRRYVAGERMLSVVDVTRGY
ncbi:MAG: D-2-hydroxyacid dehydrogenase [Steroidobacteraceae bacterium]|jgi:phosphoglycerate dehydrogenase-like enzyme|nr:D-2-hydroxyacid dehydrogenase [Steroidobacteraceae bacterium]